MAMLYIDELEPGFPSQNRRTDEISNQVVDLVVGKNRLVRIDSHPFVQDRMSIQDSRLRTGIVIGFAVPAAVSELKAKQEVVRFRSSFPMSGEKGLPQAVEFGETFRSDEKLTRIGPAIVTNRHRLAAPDEFGAA
jgi:hypothetical protein